MISAHPVASSTLVRYYVPQLSSATVRNELSWLEDRGYVAQPHTSAGRMPTTAGYRTFVNSLLLNPQYYKTIVGRSNDRSETELSTAGVAHRNASLAALNSLAAACDKLVLIHETLGILAELNRGLMVFWAPQLSNSIIHRGLPLLLTQPEFAETSAALPIMQLLESYGDLMAIFEEVMSVGGLHIKIGSENKDEQLFKFSLVAMRFDCTNLSGNSASMQTSGAKKKIHHGVTAVFGPTRMDYEWAISTIISLVQSLEISDRQKRK